MALMLPMLRADFEVCQTYRYVDEPPLKGPLTVFGGLQDETIAILSNLGASKPPPLSH